MANTAISKKDLAILKISYTNEEFTLLEEAIKFEPELVENFVTKAAPTGPTDTAAYDRIICSLFAHARNEYEASDDLPTWAETWSDAHWPNMPYRDFHSIDIFDRNSRFDRISLVSA